MEPWQTATLIKRELLTGPASTRRAYHLELQLPHPMSYKVGDSIAIAPRNDPDRVRQLLDRLGHSGQEMILHPRRPESMSWLNFLLWEANLNQPTAALQTDSPAPVDQLLPLGTPPQQLATLVRPLLPRFYSIASSPACHPDQLHLTVAYSHLSIGPTTYPGVCSHYLIDQLAPGDTLQLSHKPSAHFTLPADPHRPIIMIGPGTGIAPYRGFLQERQATSSPGPNWLFFGERNRAHDFFYESFLTSLQQQNRLRLDLAFSRDQPHKIYVQHLMQTHATDLFSWLQDGATLYVCGDAKQMAPAVDATLREIINSHGHDPSPYIKSLRHSHRYLRDVY
jgi:sulfite reductase (NADPH) flavoprotein alpha-component